MRVLHLSLSDFRNYEAAEVEFSAGRNLVVGRNGQGKTNLVEAIGYFGSLRSHRVSSDAALIRSGTDTAVARMKIGVKDREAALEFELNRQAPNRARVNGNAVRPRELMRWFSAVLFAPEDLMLVRGEPSVRRRFLDDGVIARNPAMAGIMSDFERVVRQRTSLLKSARASGSRSALDATLGVWNEQLVSSGSRIIHERRALVERLRAPLRTQYGLLVEQDHSPNLALAETVPSDERSSDEHNVSRETIEQEFVTALDRIRDQEIERAATLVGPHRDDLVLELNGLPVKGYASHGESWSFALAVKLALAALLRDESPAGDPVIILDDVFAELDSGRRNSLMSAVGDYEQVIVTAAVEKDVPDVEEWRTLRVSAGTVDSLPESREVRE